MNFRPKNLKVVLAVLLQIGVTASVFAFDNASSQETPTLAETQEDDAWEDSTLEDDNWENDSWADDTASPWTFSGFTEIGAGGFTQDNIAKSKQSLAEITARFDLSYSHESFKVSAIGDAVYDHVLEKSLWNIRELTISASPLDFLDVKVGRQVLTWGTGDYLFLNDLFAKDWQSFFSGRDDEYLKAPSNSVRLTSYFKDITFDFAWTPEFTGNQYLTGERFSFYSPIHGENIAPADNFYVEKPKDDQFSLRVATSIAGVEYALYGYKGRWTDPLGVTPEDIPYFPKMNAYGASALTPFAEGIFNAEFSYYDSTEDKDGTNPFIPNSQFRTLVGYEREVAKSLTASVQYYIESTLGYDNFKMNHPFPDEIVDEHRQLLTLRLRYLTMQQKLTLNFFAFYSPTDKDSYIKPSLNYRYSDNLSVSAGANVFSGKQQHTFFGQHKDNTNVWIRARYQY